MPKNNRSPDGEDGANTYYDSAFFDLVGKKLRPNTQRFAEHIQQTHKLKHCLDSGWYEYRDSKWEPLSDVDMRLLVKNEIETKDETNGEDAPKVQIKFADLKEVVNMIGVEVTEEKFPPMDQDLIPTLNKQLKWDQQSNDFKEVTPSPDLNVRHTLPVAHAPDAKCPQFEKAIKRILPSEDDRKVVQMYLGAALFLLNFTRKILLFIGEGSAGKSLLALLFSRILGRERVFDLKFEDLSEKFAMAALTSEHSLLSASEAFVKTLCGRGGEWAKRLVGGDEFAVQQKFQNANLEFSGRYSVIIVSNNKIRFEFETKGQEWRDRLLPIFFRESIPEAEQDKDLLDKLYTKEGPGILNWLLEGARMVRQSNWQIELTKAQRIDRDNLIAFSDPVKSFVEKFVTAGFGHFLSHDAYKLYNRLANERHLPFLEEAKFYRKLHKCMADMHGATVSTNLPGHDRNHRFARGYNSFSLKDFKEQ